MEHLLGTLNPYQAGGFFASGWVACTLIILQFWRMFSKGKIRTEREVLEIRKDRDANAALADTWRQAWQERERTMNTMFEQQVRLMKLGEVGTHVLESLPTPPATGGE